MRGYGKLKLKGFTLIEIMVVISIIAILSSIVLAAVQGTRDSARLAAGKQQDSSIYQGIGDQAMGIWNFDDCPSATTVDSSGNGNIGTLINHPVASTDTPLGIGCSMLFNGTNQTISIPNNASLEAPSEITISAWVKPTVGSLNSLRDIYRKDGGNDRTLFSFQNAGNCNFGGGTGGCISFGINVNGTYSELDVNINSSDWEGKWSYVVATYDGTKKHIYKDGVEIGNVAATGPIGTADTANAYIGSNGDSGEFFSGNIDSVHLYSTAFIAADIQKIFAEEKQEYGILADANTN